EAQYLAERAVGIVLDTVPEVDSIYYTTGGGTLSSLTGGNSTSVSINLVPAKERSRSAAEIGQALRRDLSVIAGAEISVSSAGMMDMSAMTGDAIQVSVSGNDYDLLDEVAADLTAKIAALPDAADVSSSAGEQEPEVNVTLKRDVASQYGLTAATVGTAVRSQLTGSTATTLKVNGEEISVVVKGQGDAGKNLDALKSMPITAPLGSSVPLRMVADVTVDMAPHSISRENQSRTLSISGASASDDATGIAAAVKQLIHDYPTPDGISISVGGESEEIMEAFKQLGKALIVAIGLVYFVLASQFESFLMPVIVMMILPVSLIGSLCTQILFGLKISIIAFVGVIMLAGVVVNSSIVLVDYINIRRGRGEDKETAILNACPRRVRPVMMTMLTTVLGLLPMAIGLGSGSELMRPMASCMITGMLLSTVITLFLTPVFYSLLDQAGHRKKKQGGVSDVQNQ
ncbi:MAG: efflux RND transporter permease subunit, partial [Oscillibacter sp.]|nr:efflux RND transporter permease subunit [Oscillibacter sp.]